MFVPLLFSVFSVTQAIMYLTPIQEEPLLTNDNFLRELINQMGNELADAAEAYVGYQENPKEIPIELPSDYDSIDTLNPNLSIRDQEYLRHSTLWSHQRMNDNDKVNDRYHVKPEILKAAKDEKTDNTLPAYCTPPNPCPVGYSIENNCIVDFENTADFSRDYQSAQDCMCDREHMLSCPIDPPDGYNLRSMHITNSNFNKIVEQFQEENPFFRGEKLPIAAKKGLNVAY